MVGRAHKPLPLASTPRVPPQAQVTTSEDRSRVTGVLPTGDSVEILLYGATVVSWKDSFGNEKLWLSEGAELDGSKPVRGGIPLVFPVFGKAPNHDVASKLPQHGFARTSRWEFLGTSTTEAEPRMDGAVKLDFMLSSASLDEETRKLWPYNFGLIYSVTLHRESLSTSMVISNDGDEPFECQVLMHTYLKVPDVSDVQITGLNGAEYVDKMDGAKVKQQSSDVSITAETDRVYTPVGGSNAPVAVVANGEAIFTITRQNLDNVVVWNPWAEGASRTGDFLPKDGYKNMICVEAGSVSGWQKLERGDTFEGSQTIEG